MVGTTSGLGGFMSGASIRFSKYKGGTGGADAWRDQLQQAKQQQNRDSRPRTTGMQLPKVNTIHSGTVVCTRDFGAFMQLGDGTEFKDGLMHVSHMGPERVESPEDAGLKVGTKVWVKVMEVKEDDMKYSLDMRYVDQVDGKDLDPYNTKGRCPNNRWNGGKVAKPTKPVPSLSADDKVVAPPAVKRKEPEFAPDNDDSESSDCSDEREKVSKKLKKARKKLEKAKKKEEKAKRKAEKKATKKPKKEASSGSDD